MIAPPAVRPQPPPTPAKGTGMTRLATPSIEQPAKRLPAPFCRRGVRAVPALPALVPLLLLAAAPAAAQTTLSLTAGGNIASVDLYHELAGNQELDALSGVSFGLAADFSLSDRFGIQLSGRYSPKGASLLFETELFPEDALDIDIDTDGSLGMNYLEFAALARLRFPVAGDRVSIDLVTGPAVAAMEDCTIHFALAFEELTLDRTAPCDESGLDASAADFGWTVGGGLDIALVGNVSASPRFLYTHGLLDVDKESATSARHRAMTLQIGLAYTLR